MSVSDPRFAVIQGRLKLLGLYDPPIDTEFGPAMEAGIDKLLDEAEAGQAHVRPAVQPVAPAPVRKSPYSFPRVDAAYRSWLEKTEYLPRHLVVALGLVGTLEVAGAGNSPTIMGWRDELRSAGINVAGYTGDAVPWCGLFIAYVMLKATRPVVDKPLWALSWSKWGQDGGQPELGDVLTFKRDGGGHVAIYIAEDRLGYYHVLGGNQGDKVNIMRIAKSRMYSCRQPAYVERPACIRPVIVSAAGIVSHNEA